MSAESWQNAALALRLLALDPQGLGGAVIKMRASPARDAVLAQFSSTERVRKLPTTISDEQLFGGLDLAATLAAGHVTTSSGFFDTSCIALIPMAERCDESLAAKLCHLTDAGQSDGIVALDEGIERNERVPDSLADRLAFHIAPEGRMPDNWATPASNSDGVSVSIAEAQIQLTVLAVRFGISSLRAPLLALNTARVHARLHGRSDLTSADVETAAKLVYPHRATQMPETDDDTAPPPPSESDDTPSPQNEGEVENLTDTDMLVDAVTALLPDGVLKGLAAAGTNRRSNGNGAGQKRTSNRRGRPLPSRPGRLDGTSRIDLIATLRAAAPWQPMRQAQQPERTGLLIRPSDIRLKRYAQHSDRLLIFSVDASGSAAVSRLGEAKGAIELLLADAYASRDHVALIAFRGTEAELLLPPTRSLVQTKRRLSAMPGGGGTPLAAGLQSAMELAEQSQGRGLSPTIVVLTDGRANIALDGAANRTQAAADAHTVARAIRVRGTKSLVIDMSNRPQRALEDLGRAMDGAYIALPRADAQRVTGAVTAALGG